MTEKYNGNDGKIMDRIFLVSYNDVTKLNRGQVRKGSAEMKRKVKAMGLTALAAVLAAGTCGAEARADDVKTINMYTMGIGNTTDNQMVQDAINEISREKIGVEVNWTVLDIGQWLKQ